MPATDCSKTLRISLSERSDIETELEPDALEDEALVLLAELDELVELACEVLADDVVLLDELPDELPQPASPSKVRDKVQISAVRTIFERFMDCSLVRI